jgi:hypothetical protein
VRHTLSILSCAILLSMISTPTLAGGRDHDLRDRIGLSVKAKDGTTISVLRDVFTVRGMLSPRLVQEHFHQSLEELTACAVAGYERKPDIEGIARVRFVVVKSGEVKGMALRRSSLADAETDRCFLDVLQGRTLPPDSTEEDTIVELPIIVARAQPSDTTSPHLFVDLRRAFSYGSLPKEQIRSVIRLAREEVTTCYEDALRDDPTLKGTVKMRFFIGASGRPVSVKVAHSDIPVPSFLDCLTGELERLRFPKPNPSGQIIVNYPFNFNTD